jgi:hypothetical protein
VVSRVIRLIVDYELIPSLSNDSRPAAADHALRFSRAGADLTFQRVHVLPSSFVKSSFGDKQLRKSTSYALWDSYLIGPYHKAKGGITNRCSYCRRSSFPRFSVFQTIIKMPFGSNLRCARTLLLLSERNASTDLQGSI